MHDSGMKILIADDEALARERIVELLRDIPDCTLTGQAVNGRDAVEQAIALQADVVIMDIAMPVMDGLEAARHLQEVANPPCIIFCTAFDEHALAAFDAAAIDYLVKPVRKERLQQAIDRARAQRAGLASTTMKMAPLKRRTHLSASLRGSLRLIAIEDIYYLQADEKYVAVHHARGEDLIEESLKSLEQEFADVFLRIHRNCLVSRNEFLELRRDNDGGVHAILRHGKQALEVSRRCVPGLREQLKHL
ncbi:MAG TPA: LytTR family DNA-binding domain-containing protein [Arenimonas sp.]|nr:LytTR family DNA-binding domain-containing protein [Arenimonas sp.]